MADTAQEGLTLYPPDAPPQPAPQVSVYGDSAPSAIDGIVIDDRATKNHFGLGDLSPGKEQLTNDSLTGNEDARRRQLASQQDVKDLASRQQIFQEVTAMHKPGEPLTPHEIRAIEGLKPENFESYRNDPQTFYEKQFAQKVQEAADQSGYDKLFADAQRDFKPAQVLKDQSEKAITRQQAFIKLAQDEEAKWGQLGILAKTYSFAQGALPFLAQYRYVSTLGTENGNELLTGSTKQEAIENLWLLPQDQAIALAKQQISKLSSIDPLLGMEFAHNLVKYSTTDKFLDNTMNIADLLSVAAPLIKGTLGATRYATAAKDLVRSTSQRTLDTSNILEGIGDINTAANAKAIEAIGSRLNATGNPKGFDEIKTVLPPYANPTFVLDGPSGAMATPRAQRLMLTMTANNEQFNKILNQPIPIERLAQGSLARRTAEKATDELFNTQAPSAADAILGVRTINQGESASGGLYRAYEIGKKGVSTELYPNLAENAELRRATNPLRDQRDINAILKQPTKTLVSANDDIAIQLGTKETSLFESAEAANRAAKEDYGLRGYFIKQKGQGYHIEYHKAINEDTVDVANALLQESTRPVARGPVEWLLGKAGGGLNTVDKTLAGDMVVSTYGSTGLHELIKSIAKPLEAVTNKSMARKSTRQNFTRYLEAQRDHMDAATGLRGRFDTSLSEFETNWHAMHGSMPNEHITKAYFAYTDLVNKDYILRNIAATGSKVRQGLEKHAFAYSGRTETGQFARITPKAEIEGRVIKGIDWAHQEDAGILLWDKNVNNLKGNHFYKNYGNKKVGQQANKRSDFVNNLMDKQGYKVVQLTDIGEQALRDLPHLKDSAGKSLLPDRKIHFVLTKDLATEPLDFRQIPYRPGGHVQYPNGHFIAQPNIRVSGEGAKQKVYYSGDTHMFYHPSQKEAAAMTVRMNTAREMLLNNDPGYAAYTRKNIPFSPEDFKSKFDSKAFDINTPFFSKGSSQTLGEIMEKIHGNKLIQSKDSAWNIYGKDMNLRYMGERNQTLHSFVNNGTVESPHFNLTQSKLIDPVTAQLRASSELMRDTYLGDLKIKSASQFGARFGHLIEGASTDEIMRDPIKYMMQPNWRKNLQGVELSQLSQAKDFRRAITNMFSLKNDHEKAMYGLQQRLVDQAYSGLPGVKQVAKFVEPYLLSKTVDPLKYFKNIAFTAQVGLLVPHQMVLQAMTFTNALAFGGPISGPRGIAKSVLMHSLIYTDNPKVINRAAEIASTFGWKKEHFLESYDAWKRSGFGKVGGEHVFRDDYFHPPLISGVRGKALDFTGKFFEYGERMNRGAAWGVAYDQWRTANKLAKFDDAAQTAVLRRADLLSGSMSGANKAVWQKGVMSIPSQYLAFQARIGEQFWGKEFTTQQKMTAFATYSAMYGVPTALGAGIPVWPWADSLKQYAMSHDIDTDSNKISKVLNDGMISIAMEMFAGRKTDAATRLGPAGVTTIKDVLSGDKSLPEALGGPSGALMGVLSDKYNPSLMSNLARSGISLGGVSLDYLKSILDGTPGPGGEASVAKLKDFTNNFAGANATRKFLVMYNLGQYVAKNEETVLSNVNEREAWLSLIAGLSPQVIKDSYIALSDERERGELKKYAGNQASMWVRRAFNSPGLDDYNEAWRNANLSLEAGGLNPDERAQWFHKFTKEGNGDKVTRSFARWGTIDANRQSYMFKEMQKMNPNQGQQ